jgi:hypothetical protein
MRHNCTLRSHTFYVGSGRYKKVDTARVYYFKNRVLPDLVFGKTPDAATHRVLMFGNYKDASKSSNNAKWLEEWAQKTRPDVRSKKNKKGNKLRQTSILAYAVAVGGSGAGRTAGGRSGRYVHGRACGLVVRVVGCCVYACQ